MVKPLEVNPSFNPRRGPVVLAILDGVGFGKYADGDAVKLANTPVLDSNGTVAKVNQPKIVSIKVTEVTE